MADEEPSAMPAPTGEAGVLHRPVMADEVRSLLQPERGGWFIDCTVGLGGHAEVLLRAHPHLSLLGIDRDPEALHEAERRLHPLRGRFRLRLGNFDRLAAIALEEGVVGARGILADLGVSSLQLDRAERGFSFRRDGPLDMRMGEDAETTAADIVNLSAEEELARIFKEYGEERFARRVARRLVVGRQLAPIHTTAELRALVAGAVGRGSGRIDPATRVFQALRIAVNRELEGLDRLLDQALCLLERDGRRVVMSYHSLEDRMVMTAFRRAERGLVDQVTGRPRAETRLIELLTKRPLVPSRQELTANPRARSAKLRAARRI